MNSGWLTDWEPSERWPHYTRSNAGEVLPTPASPLGQTFSWDRGMCLGWEDGYVRIGSYSVDEFNPEYPEACGFFAGYFYINLSNVRMQGVRSPAVTVAQLDLAFFGDHPDVPPYVEQPGDDRPDLVPGIMAHLGWVMSTTSWSEIDVDKAATIALRGNRPDLASLTDAELVAYARSTQPMLRRGFDLHTVTSSSSGIAPGVLFAVGQAIGDPTVPMKLVAGIGEVDSAEPSYAMWDLSRLVASSVELTAAFDAGVHGLLERLVESGSADASGFLAGFDRFVVDFGSRGPNEWEMTADTWETKPEIALAAIDRVRFQADGESPRSRNAAKAAERARVTAEVRIAVAEMGEELAGTFEGGIVAANQLGFRERTKTNLVRVIHEGRMAFRELGRRHAAAANLADPVHVFMLTDGELEAFVADPGSLRTTLAERHAAWRLLFDLEPPYFIRDGKVPPLAEYPKRADTTAVVATEGEVIQGVPGCPGTFVGRARVILDPSEPGDLQPGDVIVAPLTDPAWTPLFMAAGAVVVNVGGQISHAIIVSRELGLPCVVSAHDATRRIPDGSSIEVNGDTGAVTVLALAAP